MPYRFIKRTADGPYFHVFNRGSNKKAIFLSNLDYQRFLDKLQEYSPEEGVKVVCYCLMRNHYHLLLMENESGEIARLMQRLNVAYAMYFNLKYKQSGHLFQGPYGERCIDSDAYMVEVSAYIHNNPRAKGLPVDYRWSSYPDYLSGRASWLYKDPVLGYFPEVNKVQAYSQYVDASQDLVLNQELRPGLETAKL